MKQQKPRQSRAVGTKAAILILVSTLIAARLAVLIDKERPVGRLSVMGALGGGVSSEAVAAPAVSIRGDIVSLTA